MTNENEGVLKVIISIIGEVMPQLQGKDIKAANSLEELGANSMDRADIVVMTLEKLGLDISLTEVFGPRNIGELAELLSAKLQTA
jgi:polyketide biosynthesis acyl carrier protein